MLSFSGWNMFGSIAYVCLTQGTNILLNIFFGPVVNAAKGISTQVQTAVNSFCTNFQTALNPQIVKNYASNNIQQVHNLIFVSSRLSIYMVLIFSLPIISETNQVLKLWLKTVPEHAVIFVQLSMIISMFQALGNPLRMGNAATGKVKNLMSTTGIMFWSVIPISYFCLKFGGEPQSVFYVHIGLLFTTHVIRIKIVGKQLKFSFFDYCKGTLFRIVSVSIICFIPVYIVKSNMNESLPRLILICTVSVISVISTCFFIGITNEERNTVKRFIKNKIRSKNGKRKNHTIN
jgi:O-antigen/teichoic acid export membrane protein